MAKDHDIQSAADDRELARARERRDDAHAAGVKIELARAGVAP